MKNLILLLTIIAFSQAKANAKMPPIVQDTTIVSCESLNQFLSEEKYVVIKDYFLQAFRILVSKETSDKYRASKLCPQRNAYNKVSYTKYTVQSKDKIKCELGSICTYAEPRRTGPQPEPSPPSF